MQPLQRLIETRLTWPLGDALRERSGRTRAAIAAGAATLAIAAGGRGDERLRSPPGRARHASGRLGDGCTAGSDAARPCRASLPSSRPGTPTPAPAAAAHQGLGAADQVAWQFAQAFVGYEVGRSSKKTDAAFAPTATKPLAKALAKDPPRLPANRKVPQARVLNVVLGAAGKEQVTASVSLVRLRAASEVRLTLTKTGDEWRVAQVLG